MVKNLVLIGMMGAGKTSVGKALSKHLKMPFVDLDFYIENQKKTTISKIFETYGEAQFREWEKDALKVIFEGSFGILSIGGGTVIDEENRTLLREKGFCIFLSASVETLRNRLHQDQSRPLLKSASLEEIFDRRRHLYESLSDYKIETDEMEVEEVVSRILEVINEHINNEWP